MAPLTPAIVGLAALSLLTYHLLFSLILICVPKNASLLRLLSVVPLGIAALAVVQHAILVNGPKQRHAPFIGLLAIHFLGLLEYILLSRVDAAKLAALAGTDAATATLGPKIWQGLSLSCNARRLGTEWEVKNVYHRTPKQNQKARFLAHVLPRMALAYMVVDALMLAPAPEPHLVTPEKATAWRLWTLTGEDIGFRVAATTLFWLIAYCIIYVLIHITAVVAVLFHLSTPDFWPHLFGPLSELYTIRGFWGVFWHQRLRKTLTSFSDAITDDILHIPRKTTLSTYTRLFLVFAISGLLHHPTDTIQGMPPTETATVAFFLIQPLGIMMEDAVQALTRTWGLPRVVRSVAGYVWVAVFLVATTPRWMFSVARLGQSPELLPVQVVKPLMEMLTAEA